MYNLQCKYQFKKKVLYQFPVQFFYESFVKEDSHRSILILNKSHIILRDCHVSLSYFILCNMAVICQTTPWQDEARAF